MSAVATSTRCALNDEPQGGGGAATGLAGEGKGQVMSQFDEGQREAPHSLAPVQLEGGSDDIRELSKLRDGSGRRLLLMVAAVSVVTVGGVKLLDMMDERQAYATAVNQLERSDGEPRDAYLRCVLPGYSRAQITAPNGLRAQLEQTTERLQRGYGKLLASCAPLLTSFRHAAQDVRAPLDVKAEVGAVSMAAGQWAIAWGGLQEYLQRPGATYDQAQVSPLLDKIDTAWQEYQHARDKGKQALLARR